MFEGIDITALRNWSHNAYCSSFGNFLINAYTVETNSLALIYAFKFLKLFIFLYYC